MSKAERSLRYGDEYPYDMPDDVEDHVPPPKDWAHRAARGVLADLSDRRSIKWSLEGIDQEVRAEIVESLADIIRTARAGAAP